MSSSKSAEEIKNRIAGEVTASLGINLLYVGQKLGIFEAMSRCGPTNSSRLSATTGLSERYLEEFLRAVALHGYVDYSAGAAITEAGDWDSGIVRDQGTFSLSTAMAEVLLEQESDNYYGNHLLMPVVLAKPVDKLIEAFKSDGAVAFTEYGDQCSKFVDDSHSKMYRDLLVSHFMQQEGLKEVRQGFEEGGVVVDLGCGSGASSVSFAKGFPKVTIHAIDCDKVSIEKTKERVKLAEDNGEIAPGQVIPHCCFGHEAPLSPGSVDLVLLFICLHDMANPSQVLASAKKLLKEGGSVLVLEFTVPNSFSLTLDGKAPPELGVMYKELYSASVFHCLPVAKDGPESQAVGTCFSLNTMKTVAAKGGFGRVDNYDVRDGKTLFRLQV